MWKWRNLVSFGRNPKTFAIFKLMFRASVIPISNYLAKEAIFYNFIWNGKDKVKRCTLISDIDKVGLKMLDIESMISKEIPEYLEIDFKQLYFTCWWESSSALQL